MIRKKFLMRCTLSWHLPDTVSAEEAEEAGEKYMSTFAAIVFAILTIILAFVLIVALPVLAGKLFFRWSARRVRYIVSQSTSAIVTSVVTSLIITGLILLVGLVFHQQWAFSGGLLIVYTFWTAIRTVRQAIEQSKHM